MSKEQVEAIEPVSKKTKKEGIEAWEAFAIPIPQRPILFTPERFLGIVFDSQRDVFKRISANHHKIREENNEAIKVDEAAKRRRKTANLERQQQLENLNMFHRKFQLL